MTGFQKWIAARAQGVRETVCWWIGHRIAVGPWVRSPNTCHTHFREHTCERCGVGDTERGYFDALQRGKGGAADAVPW